MTSAPSEAVSSYLTFLVDPQPNREPSEHGDVLSSRALAG